MRYKNKNNDLKTFSELKGCILKNVERSTKLNGDEELIFTLTNGGKYKLYHRQDCCEEVRIEDICGDLNDLIGSEIVQAEENSNNDNPEGFKAFVNEYQESFTWTYYRIATAKGQVVIRWYGESNGYYSESVDWTKIS